MSINYYLTTSAIFSEIFNLPPLIQKTVYAINLACNAFPRILPYGKSNMSSSQEQEKLNRIQKMANELLKAIGLNSSQVEVRISSNFADQVTYMGSTSSMGGGLLLVGEKLFKEFESQEILESPLYQEWKEAFEKMPESLDEFAKHLDSLTHQERKRLLNLAKKFESTVSTSEMKARLMQGLGNLQQHTMLKSNNFYMRFLGIGHMMSYAATFLYGGAYLYQDVLPHKNYFMKKESLFFNFLGTLYNCLCFLVNLNHLKKQKDLEKQGLLCGFDKGATDGHVELQKKRALICILEKTQQLPLVENSNLKLLRPYIKSPEKMEDLSIIRNEQPIFQYTISKALQDPSSEIRKKLQINPASKIEVALGVVALTRQWVDLSFISDYGFSCVRNVMILDNRTYRILPFIGSIIYKFFKF